MQKLRKRLSRVPVYYDMAKEDEQIKAIAKERNEIIGQMIADKNKGLNTQEPKKRIKKEYHCDTLEQ